MLLVCCCQIRAKRRLSIRETVKPDGVLVDLCFKSIELRVGGVHVRGHVCDVSGPGRRLRAHNPEFGSCGGCFSARSTLGIPLLNVCFLKTFVVFVKNLFIELQS